MNTPNVPNNFNPGLTLSLMMLDKRIATVCGSFDQAIATAVNAIDPNTLCPVAPPDADSALQPKSLLTSIVRCYAQQIYGSTEIETILARDTKAETFGLALSPDAETIRTFRGQNRRAIQMCLMIVLALLAIQTIEAGTITKVNPSHLAEEASRRITMAMFTDSMDLGEN